jgi:hypothetical protein
MSGSASYQLRVRRALHLYVFVHWINGGRYLHASHCVQVTLIPQSDDSNVSCSIFCSSYSMYQIFVIQNRGACPWLYSILCHYFWFVNISVRRSLTLNSFVIIQYALRWFWLMILARIFPSKSRCELTFQMYPSSWICSDIVFLVYPSA